MLLRKLFYSLSPLQRRLARRLWYFPRDLFSSQKDLVPPKGMIFTGAGDFEKIGNKMANKIITECKLQPDDYVLDAGCGIGRIARPLTKYISSKGAYYGFDVVPEGVAWCKRNYGQFPHFHFTHVPVENDLYNNNAQVKDWQFRFPYDDAYFSAVIVVSVFTHMQLQGVENYLHEISRVLRPGKYCFSTFFIMTEERSLNVNSFFKYKFDNYYLHDEYVKDANVAYPFATLEKMIADSGLKIATYLPGWWNDGDADKSFDFQDVLVLEKL